MNRHRVAHTVFNTALLIALSSTASARTAFAPDATDHYHYPGHANGQETASPYLDATRTQTPIQLDGRLDDPAWTDVPAGWGFVEHDPERGIPASEETVFKVAYDDDALYFGVACFEKDATKTSSALSRRDNLQNSDMVSIYIDPYHDRTTGYNFRVNPDGVQADHYIFDDGNRDPDWDAVWESETSRDEHGWYTEVRIPFSAIRYRPESEMTWGLQVYRWMHGRGEDTGWATWDRNAAGFVSHWGELRNLRNVPAARQLEVVPYVVTRSTDPSVAGAGDEWDGFQNFGADLKYGITADLTLNATFQPDFGQVEADPSVLNLGPFETYFEERRPFFVEGARFFEHPNFNLFYSRRIGAGDENTRIRFASKMMGKTAGDVSVAGLVAATDETRNGQTHNPFVSGTNETWYALGRVGKEFSGGDHRFNVMQTAVVRDEKLRLTEEDDRISRDAYSTGADFELNFVDRTYRVLGSWVGTVVEHAPALEDESVDGGSQFGTGGSLQVGKYGGEWRGSLGGRWEHDQLDPNDMGLLSAPDEWSTYAWMQRRITPGEDALIINGSVNLNLYRSWLYAGRTQVDPDDPQTELFSYGRRTPQSLGGNINGWFETRHRWSSFYGAWYDAESRSKYATRTHDGIRGPLLRSPREGGMWWGVNSDWRKKLAVDADLNLRWSAAGAHETRVNSGIRWVQSNRLNHRLTVGFTSAHDDAQWMDNFATSTGGIGGVSYVFGELDRRTLDVTLRSNILFTRDQSLEIYVQPFLATGDYSNARQLARADSYEFDPYAAEDFEASDFDFSLGSVNANVVYRWEYRAGSTLYFVWTHARGSYSERGDTPRGTRFSNDFGPDALFRNEPENTFLAKLSYWFSI